MNEQEKVALQPGDAIQINGEDFVVEEVNYPISPEAIAAADAALVDLRKGSFSVRNAGLGKMINCTFCGHRHRRTDVTYREQYDENDKKTVSVVPVRSEQCKQVFQQLWVEEDVETGELSIQYAVVPLPGQKPKPNNPKSIVGAAMFKGKRKKQRPNHTGLEVVEHTRKIFARINPTRFPEEAGRMLEAKRIAINTVKNRRARIARKLRAQQKLSRKINRGR